MLNSFYIFAQSCYEDCLNRGNTPSECRAGCPSGNDSIIGEVKPPPIEGFKGLMEGGLTTFINNILKLLIIGAGIFAVINLVLAGYAFMSAGDDPKKVAGAWQKIFQTLIGLAFAAGAFVLAAIFGQLIFGDPTALLQLKIFGPGQ
jgi:hypothetical protein